MKNKRLYIYSIFFIYYVVAKKKNIHLLWLSVNILKMDKHLLSTSSLCVVSACGLWLVSGQPSRDI